DADDPAVDIASVGALLFAMLSGASVDANSPPPALWARDLSPEARALVDRALATDATRWPDVQSMLAALAETRLAMVQPSRPPHHELCADPAAGGTLRIMPSAGDNPRAGPSAGDNARAGDTLRLAPAIPSIPAEVPVDAMLRPHSHAPLIAAGALVLGG